jgi:hypothetical protein
VEDDDQTPSPQRFVDPNVARGTGEVPEEEGDEGDEVDTDVDREQPRAQHPTHQVPTDLLEPIVGAGSMVLHRRHLPSPGVRGKR